MSLLVIGPLGKKCDVVERRLLLAAMGAERLRYADHCLLADAKVLS